jgi:transcriptional regulator with XRE-family HTH domain
VSSGKPRAEPRLYRESQISVERKESLGEALRALRKEHGLTQTQFGKWCGLTQSTVSDIENANIPVTVPMKDSLVSGLAKLEDKQRVFNAWRREHAPSPVESPFTVDWSDSEIQQYVTAAPRLIERGEYAAVVANLWKMHRLLSRDPRRFEVAMFPSIALHDALAAVERRSDAVNVAERMITLAKADGHTAWQSEWLWRRSLTEDASSQLEAGSFLSQADEVIAARRPTTELERTQYLRLACGIARDRAAAADRVVRNKESTPDFLNPFVAQLQFANENIGPGLDRALGYEVLARPLACLGRIGEAHESIEQSRKESDPNDLTTAVKNDTSTIDLLVIEENEDAALNKIATAVTVCRTGDMTHQLKVLLSYEQRILDGQRSRRHHSISKKSR